MLTIYHSNRLDVLKEILVALIQKNPLDNPLTDEQILVQSPGMAQWLRLKLAEGLGIAASVTFPLPASFLWDMYIRVLPDVPKRSAFNKEAMTWKIMALLDTLLDDERFRPLKRYLAGDSDDLKIYQLAGKIADIFDQYLVYRPDWIHEWEAGNDLDTITAHQQWQPVLWRHLVEHTAALQQSHWHRANMHDQFRRVLTQAQCPASLPERLFVFGISAMPPHFIESLDALSQSMDVHLMITNPCQYYWGDVKNSRYIAKLAARQFALYSGEKRTSSFIHQTVLDAENGNPLLGSMGKLGRDYLSQIHDLNGTDIDAFENVPDNSLLHCIQRDILELQDSTASADKRTVSASDQSLTIHSCHSPLREVEVLHDRLLDLFDRKPDITPKDIVVMLPDVDTYSPWIQAVFGSLPKNDPRYIPFSVSDRSVRSEHPILAGVLTLLDLDNSRCSASELLQLLDIPALQQRFSLEQEDLTILRQWINDVGIRWGLNEKQLKQQGFPEINDNTWLFGLKRMLLGYAMGEDAGLYAGILPFDPVQGMTASLCGLLANFIDDIEALTQSLGEARPIQEWVSFIHQMLDQFFAPDEDDALALKRVRDALEHLHEQLTDADHRAPLSKAVLYRFLSERLNNDRSSQRFLAGQVNFCTLMPMRSIPFQVVCLLGMNDSAYPRTLAPAGFDLIAHHPRHGDRSRREDDRYLFLEALLAAEEHFYISYTGRSIQDNSKQAPSVLVTELLNYCTQGFVFEDYCSSPDTALITEYPLQAFSPDNFNPGHHTDRGTLFSYAKEWLPAARHEGKQRSFVKTPLPEVPLPETLALKDFVVFFKNPCKYFLQRRLNVFFPDNQQVQKETEPFDLIALEKYHFNEVLLETLVKGDDVEHLFAQEAARGHLPHRAQGVLFVEEQLQRTEGLAKAIREEIACARPCNDRKINVTYGMTQLTGWLTGLLSFGQLRYRPSSIKGKDILAAWVEHICYCHSGGQGVTRLLGFKDTGKSKLDEITFAPLQKNTATQYLDELLELYHRGMRSPLPLFSETAQAWLKHKDETIIARKTALDVFYGTEGNNATFSDSDDVYIGRVFPELEPVFEDMTVLAEALPGKALDHQQ